MRSEHHLFHRPSSTARHQYFSPQQTFPHLVLSSTATTTTTNNNNNNNMISSSASVPPEMHHMPRCHSNSLNMAIAGHVPNFVRAGAEQLSEARVGSPFDERAHTQQSFGLQRTDSLPQHQQHPISLPPMCAPSFDHSDLMVGGGSDFGVSANCAAQSGRNRVTPLYLSSRELGCDSQSVNHLLQSTQSAAASRSGTIVTTHEVAPHQQKLASHSRPVAQRQPFHGEKSDTNVNTDASQYHCSSYPRSTNANCNAENLKQQYSPSYPLTTSNGRRMAFSGVMSRCPEQPYHHHNSATPHASSMHHHHHSNHYHQHYNAHSYSSPVAMYSSQHYYPSSNTPSLFQRTQSAHSTVTPGSPHLMILTERSVYGDSNSLGSATTPGSAPSFVGVPPMLKPHLHTVTTPLSSTCKVAVTPTFTFNASSQQATGTTNKSADVTPILVATQHRRTAPKKKKSATKKKKVISRSSSNVKAPAPGTLTLVATRTVFCGICGRRKQNTRYGDYNAEIYGNLPESIMGFKGKCSGQLSKRGVPEK